MQPDLSNPHFQTALQYVNFTSRNIYLTGKAGTGKTTFLKFLKENCYKKLTIAAPTGIAAINAGGVTLHSLFQLPFGAFVPTRQNTREYTLQGIHNQQSVFFNIRLNKEKRRLLEELELLIIDEVSMVRADVLDAVDIILRSIRRQPGLPFGGVQMLFIGDLFQLPPVINDEEWKTLTNFYSSPFFFEAHALKENPLIYLELKKIYRQSEADFIRILNNIRNNKILPEDLEVLHKYHKPGFQPAENEEYITLTTHNAKAETINNRELKKLPGKLHTFTASVEGNFEERNYPAEYQLNLKEGAQVMFIKNDKGEERRYYNGKIGRINKIDGEYIYIKLPERRDEILLEKEIWKKVKYQFNNDSDRIEEEVTGTFMQYPIRLAWAITIHKSQGLTFEKAIIDAIDSFTAGQVYVALSRLTSLEGLVLTSKILPNCISSEERVIHFSESESAIETLQENLVEEQKDFLHRYLLEIFNWNKVLSESENFLKDFEERKIPMQEKAKKLFEELHQKIKKQQETAGKFCLQLEKLMSSESEEKYQLIHQRSEAGVHYFQEAIQTELLIPLKEHYEQMKLKAKTKKYLKEVQDLASLIKRKNQQLEQSVLMSKGLVEGTEVQALLEQMKTKPEKQIAFTERKSSYTKKSKPVKGESHRTSLQLFKEGKNIKEIAEIRSMALSTIEGHLVSFIPTGEIEIQEIVKEDKIATIRKVIDEFEGPSSLIKEKLGDDYSYTEIKAVISYIKKGKEAEV